MEVKEELEDGRKNLIESDFKNIVYNRLNEHYKPIHELGKIIWQNTGISDLYKFRKSSINSLFIPMHVVFEKFLENLFENYFPEFQVEAQTNKPAWKKQEEIDAMLTTQGTTYNIRTDILLKQQSVVKHLIDAKYKEDISTTDRYEIGFYIHEYEINDGFAILPYSKEEEQNNHDYLITSERLGITIHIKHVDIDNMLDLIAGQNNVETRNKISKLITPLPS